MNARIPPDIRADESAVDRTADVGAVDAEAVELSAEDIEAAYARALETVNAVEQAVPELGETDSDSTQPPLQDVESVESIAETGVSDRDVTRPRSSEEQQCAAPDPERGANPPEHVLQPEHVIEAALFVGGGPLTTKRLAKIVGQESSGETVEQLIARLNEQYLREERPYEIRLQEGGYQLTLREEFERVRDRVFGRNPKEVKLSQEALEVLAFVAYRQPVRCEDIEAAGKPNAAGVLRQLLRRRLVSLERSDDDSESVTYSTTPRFLEVFSLRHIDELPLPEDFALK